MANPLRLDAAREERLRGLLFEFAIGVPSGKQFDQSEMELLRDDVTALLGEIDFLRHEHQRDTQFIERLERANSTLIQSFAEEQRERELLTEEMANAMAVVAEFFQRANQLRGKGTPRAVPHSITHEPPRIAATGA